MTETKTNNITIKIKIDKASPIALLSLIQIIEKLKTEDITKRGNFLSQSSILKQIFRKTYSTKEERIQIYLSLPNTWKGFLSNYLTPDEIAIADKVIDIIKNQKPKTGLKLMQPEPTDQERTD